MEMFGILLIFLLIVIFSVYSRINQNQREEIAQQINSNDSYKKALQQQGFIISKSYVLGGNAIFVDDINKKWSFKYTLSDVPNIFLYSELLQFEIFEDDLSVIQGTQGKALVGGLLFGTTGSVIGSASQRQISQFCNNIRMRIIINNLQLPLIEAHLVKGQMDKSGQIYRDFITKANEFIGILSYIQANAN